MVIQNAIYGKYPFSYALNVGQDGNPLPIYGKKPTSMTSSFFFPCVLSSFIPMLFFFLVPSHFARAWNGIWKCLILFFFHLPSPLSYHHGEIKNKMMDEPDKPQKSWKKNIGETGSGPIRCDSRTLCNKDGWKVLPLRFVICTPTNDHLEFYRFVFVLWTSKRDSSVNISQRGTDRGFKNRIDYYSLGFLKQEESHIGW